MHTTKDAKDPHTIRLVAMNDPHYAASSPPAFKERYLEHLEENVKQVIRHAAKINADAILWAGDIFHLKDPRHNPLWLISKVIKTMSEAKDIHNLPSLGIGGNHDYKHGCLEAGLYGSPLQLLIDAGAYQLLDEHEHVIKGKDFEVRIAGGSYHHSQAQHVRDKKKQGADHLVVLGHFWLGLQTGEFFGEPLYGLDFFKDSEADIIVVGHHHEDKGVIEKHNKLFVSQGSISITGAHPHDLQRRPAAALIEITKDNREVKLLRPKGKPASELIDLDRHQQIKEEKKEMEDFIEKLNTSYITSTDPELILAETAPTEEIRVKALEYIQEAEAASV